MNNNYNIIMNYDLSLKVNKFAARINFLEINGIREFTDVVYGDTREEAFQAAIKLIEEHKEKLDKEYL